VRFPDDKNNEAFHAIEAAWFNSTIHDLALLEIPLLGRQFTWSNHRDNPTLVCLDRVFVNDSWDSLFPNTTLTARTQTTFDHFLL